LGRTLGSSSSGLSESTRPAPIASKRIDNQSNRNETTQRKFNRIIAEYVSSKCRLSASQLARLFYNATNNNVVWAALVQQLEDIYPDHNLRTNDVVRKLINNSARMIEEEFSDLLPR